MDPSTHPHSPPLYTAFPPSTIYQNQIPPQKSPALLGCGIALIVTSTLCLIPLSILICMPTSNVTSAWFVFNLLYLLMAMHCVYAGCSVAERHQSIVSTMIMGIVATVGTVPIVIGFGIAISSPYIEYSTEVTVIVSIIFSIINIGLAIAIAVLACHKTCDCCKPAFHPIDRQSLTSNMA